MMHKHISAILPEIIKLRQTIHSHPELKYQEFKTAELIATTLKSFGYEPETGIAKTGVVATLDSGKPGKTVALRADMDALPLQEKTNLPFASQIPGQMHACGHDGHVATLLLAAYILKKHSADFSGKIKFIFQPAEEGGHGAQLMIDEGVLKNVDAIFGYHNIPTFPKNKILVREACILAGCANFVIEVKGIGGHSSAPEKAMNPIHLGSNLFQTIHNLINQKNPPFDQAVIAITQFHSGAADNVISDKAIMRGTIRFTNPKTIELIKSKMQQVVSEANASIEFPQITPATINSKNETAFVKNLAEKLFGSDNVQTLEKNLMATEDFSFYLNQIPGCFFLIGTGVDKQYVHHPEFTFEDEILPIAGELMATIALKYLS